jgi:hypothetical protein
MLSFMHPPLLANELTCTSVSNQTKSASDPVPPLQQPVPRPFQIAEPISAMPKEMPFTQQKSPLSL